ncbi:MAG: hypothetical protein K9G11_03105 [Rickettsiaceae bacterium]|nr:hypothetical protein [Rickettsiaceae bacterium]
MRAQPIVEYVWKESVVLDCHALQARNDASTLPLDGVAFLSMYRRSHLSWIATLLTEQAH